MINNKEFRSAALLAIALFIFPALATGQANGFPDAATVNRVHQNALTVDTHCDTPMDMAEEGFDIGKRNQSGQVDLPRMKEGGLDAMFFAVFTGQKKRIDANYAEAYQMACRMIDSTRAAVTRHSALAGLALTSDDAAKLEKEGKRAVYIGIENGFPIAQKLDRVEEFYRKGARYITLCHSYNNDICDSSTDPKGAEHNGLSSFGREVVKEMNRLGMIIDVSHISDKSFYDVVAISASPVIASHSSVRAIAHNNRNLSDEMIVKLARNGGVIQICLLDEYIKDPDTTTYRYKREHELRKIFNEKQDTMTETERVALRKEWGELRTQHPKALPTVAEYVHHIDHVVKLVGVNHVGIGSDFDGGGGLADCGDVSQFSNITRELLRRGYSESDIMKIWGGNFFRVFREVEANARKLSGTDIH